MITEELKEKVKEVFKDCNLNGNSIHQILKNNIELKNQLQMIFNQKPKIYNSIGKLVILIYKDIELKHCKICGKQMSYDKTMSENSLFCSNKCKLNSDSNPFKNKKIQEKIRQKWFKKYGVYNPGQSIELIQKRKETCIKKYGVSNPCNSKEIKEKIKKTINEKYNGSQWNNKEIRKKMIRGRFNTTYQKLVERYKKQNIQPLFMKEQFIGTNHRYKWKCTKCGNEFQAVYHNGIINSRCFKCHPRIVKYTSSYQKEIYEFLKKYNIEIIKNDKKLISPNELDLVIPQKKIAIQFNGSYWHSNNIKEKYYHVKKTQKCQNIGYKLIHIFEYDWRDANKKKIIKEKLKAILNIEQSTIYARKCIIDDNVYEFKKTFLNENHIQGNDSSSICLGLRFNNQLVAIMTFGKPRFNKKFKWELMRYATKSGYRILGGAGKLLSYFRKKYQGNIITYADRKYSNGNMYQKLGFKFQYNTEPNYVWINSNKKQFILNRYKTQKNKLNKLLKNFDSNKTEVENMQNNGFYQVFDAGNKVYSLK